MSAEQQQAGSSPEQQLLEACRAGQLERAQQLLADGAEPSFQDTEGISPLMAAAETGDADLVAALLGACASCPLQHHPQVAVTGSSAAACPVPVGAPQWPGSSCLP